MTTPIANVNNATLNSLVPNLDIGDVADPALRLAAFQYIYAEMQVIITAYNAFVAAGGIATGNLADLSVTTGKLADLAATAGKIADLAVVTGKINDLAVTAAKIATGTITSAQIADLGIATADLADALITTIKIADLNVTTAKIADSAVTLAKMADSSVGTTELVDLAVTNGKIANGTLTAAKFVADALTNETQNALRITELEDESATSILRFGAAVDGITDDTAAIQAAIKYCFDNGVNLYGVPGTSIISGTIYIPSNPTFNKQLMLDFRGITFQIGASATLFESGRFVSGSWVSTFGDPEDTYNSFGVTLRGFNILGGSKGIRISSWHQGCSVEYISASNCETVVEAKACYYSNFENIKTLMNATLPYTGSRFIFSGSCNLMRLTRLSATNSNIGYQFISAVTALQMSNISFEGMAIGVQFESEVFDAVIENSYAEAVSDVVIKCQSNVDNLTIKNNYINYIGYTSMYFIDYVELPLNNIIIEQDNKFINQTGDSKIIKTLSTTLGYNSLTFKRPPKFGFTPSELLVDNTIFSNQLFIQQEFNLTGARARLVNRYATGTYSGRYTAGFASGVPGCTWVNNSNAVMTLDTRIVFSDTQRIYVYLRIASSGLSDIKGEFIGSVFYEFTATTVTVSTALTISTVNGFQRITSGTLPGTVSSVSGEVRLI